MTATITQTQSHPSRVYRIEYGGYHNSRSVPKRGTQNWKLLQYLMSGRRISQSDASEWFGISRLASRVDELQNMGWRVDRKMRNVEGKRFASYYMEPSVFTDLLYRDGDGSVRNFTEYVGVH